MRTTFTLITLAVVLSTGCAAMQPKPVTFAPKCEQNLSIEGTDETGRIGYMARLACMDLEEATGRELHRMPPVRLRVYGAGDAPEVCSEHRSGTCTVAHPNGSYTVELRKPNMDEVREGKSVESRALHEFKHVALFELKPELCTGLDGEACSEAHHKELYRLHVCPKGECSDVGYQFNIFGE